MGLRRGGTRGVRFGGGGLMKSCTAITLRGASTSVVATMSRICVANR